MPNQYTRHSYRPIIRPIGPSIAYIELTRGYFSLVDSDKADTLFCCSWVASGKKYPYAVSQIRGRRVKMHRILMEEPQNGLLVDHKNGNTLDNRISNLRIATYSQNSYNTKLHSNNKSGYRGVFYHEKDRAWRAAYRVGNKTTFLGVFPTAEAGHTAYVEAIKHRAGEFMGQLTSQPLQDTKGGKR